MSGPLSNKELNELLDGIRLPDDDNNDDDNDDDVIRYDSRRIRPYDFQRPKVFLKSQLHKFSDAFEHFCMGNLLRLSKKLGKKVRLYVASVDPLFIDESSKIFDEKDNFLLLKVKTDEGVGDAVFQIDSKIANFLVEESENKLSIETVMKEMLSEFTPSLKKVGIDASIEQCEYENDKSLVITSLLNNVEFDFYNNQVGILITMEMQVEDELVEDARFSFYFLRSTVENMLKANDKKTKESLKNNKEDRFDNIPIDVSAVLGYTQMSVNNLKQLKEGTIIELDKLAALPVYVNANGTPIGLGEVMIICENFGVRITELRKPE